MAEGTVVSVAAPSVTAAASARWTADDEDELNRRRGEKKRLQRVLNAFETEYSQLHGRAPKSKEERAARGDDYRRYKMLKGAVARLEEKLEAAPPPKKFVTLQHHSSTTGVGRLRDQDK